MSRDPARESDTAGCDQRDPQRWKALAVYLVAGVMTLLDISMVNVALPSIQEGTGAGQNALSWIVSGPCLIHRPACLILRPAV